MDKPTTCRDCPFYDDGKGFVPDEHPDTPTVFLLLQNPSKDDEDDAQPATGKTGQFLENSLLDKASLTRGVDVAVGHTLRCRWRNPVTRRKEKELPKGIKGAQLVAQAARHCEQYTSIPASVRVIVAAGQPSANHYGAITGSIDEWHGFIAPRKYHDIPVFLTKNPATLFYDLTSIIPSMHDWSKVGQFLQGSWPTEIPERHIVYRRDDRYMELLRMASESSILAIDTEYDNKGDTIWPGELTLIGVAFRDKKGAIQGFQIPWGRQKVDLAIAEDITNLLMETPSVFWNAQADIPVLHRVLSLSINMFQCIHDAMLAHALLYTEQPHTLESVESLYSPYGKQKHLGSISALDYNWGDCLTLLHAWEDLEDDLKRDPQSTWLYENQSLPLVEMILEAKARGIKLDHAYLDQLVIHYQAIMDYAHLVARGYSGWAWLNLGSSHHIIAYMTHHQYPFPPRKKKYVTDEDTIAWYRQRTHDYNPDDEVEGISITLMNRYLDEKGCQIVLTCRAMYQKAAALLNGYINPLRGTKGQWKDRVHPDQFTHTQNTGRWSTIKPPISNLKKVLKPMLVPDPGWCFLSFDKSQVELRLIAAVTDDTLMLEAFEKGWDVHTLNMCTFFGFEKPSDPANPYSDQAWMTKYNLKGKDDERRTFSKTFVFRLSYGGDPRKAGDIPGARKLGLDGPKLARLAQNYLREHFYLQQYWNRMDDQILKTRTVRTPWGRKRYLNGPGPSGRHRAKICLEGCNHPYQGGVSDHFNDLALRIWWRGQDVPLRWVRGVHDYQCFTCPSDSVTIAQAQTILQEENDIPMLIHGQLIHLPADMNEVVYGES